MANKKIKIPEFPKCIEIMGVPWKIIVKPLKDDHEFKRSNCDGYCCIPVKTIVILDYTTDPTYDNETQEFVTESMKHVLRHEIVHAVFAECGLTDNAARFSGPWVKNEEMIDWIAAKGQVIYKLWEKAGCLSFMSPEDYMGWKTATATVVGGT